jgi:hydroxymethylpyrimidine/phosphomethylpyrimidine kinase
MKQMTKVLTIAGSDSGGGAGIQGDLKSFSAHGCFGMSVITALTAQTVHGVKSVLPVAPDFVKAQLDAIFAEMRPNAVKIGMVLNRDIIEVIAESINHFEIPNVVLDPVMLSKSGHSLLEDAAVDAMKSELFPLSLVITPNIPEAARVLERMEPETPGEIEEMARNLQEIGNNPFVVLKGGHSRSENSSDDFLFGRDGSKLWLKNKRFKTRNTHGTGCAFSSSIVSWIARGCEPVQAITNAKKFISNAIQDGAAFDWNGGNGPIQHFASF